MYCEMCLQQALEGKSFCIYCGSSIQAPMGSLQKRVEVDRVENVTQILYYDLWDGRLGSASDSKGIAIVKWEYDSAGKKTRESFYGGDGRLMEDSIGIAIYEWGYDGSGNLVQARYFNKRRFPQNYGGTAVLEWQYDSAGNVVLERRYEATENKSICGIGFSEYKYDHKGNLVQEKAYDKKGLLVQTEMGLRDYSRALRHAQEKDYSEYESVHKGCTKKKFSISPCVWFSLSSKDSTEGLTPQMECESDRNTARIKYYDGNGNLTEDLLGVAIYEWTYICPFEARCYIRRITCYKKSGALNIGQTLKHRIVYDVLGGGFDKLIKLKRALRNRKVW